MFDLETALATWRHQFKYTRTLSAADLDEMERHLRDQVRDLVAGGMFEEDAYRTAFEEMGEFTEAASEYSKVHWNKVIHRNGVLHEIDIWRSMVSNYVKLATRNMMRNRVPTVINMVGLSIALATCIVVFLFLSSWYSMDAFHENGDQIFIAQADVLVNNEMETWGRVPIPLGPALKADIPLIKDVVRIYYGGANVQKGEQSNDESILFVDGGF